MQSNSFSDLSSLINSPSNQSLEQEILDNFLFSPLLEINFLHTPSGAISTIHHLQEKTITSCQPDLARTSGTDLLGSLSGGGDSGMGGSGSCFSLDICPDLILALIAAAAAGGFYFLYITITMAGRKRKRKRSLCEPQTESVGQILSDILNLGEVGYIFSLGFQFSMVGTC